MEDIFEKLREIVNLGANRINKDSKAYLLDFAKANGIDFKPTRCKSCWIDLAMQIAQLYIPKDAKESGRKVWLKQGVQVLQNGELVNCTTALNDDDCIRIIRKGCPKSYFEFADDFDFSKLER